MHLNRTDVLKNPEWKWMTSPERFELSRGNPMYLAGTRLNHSAKATLLLEAFATFLVDKRHAI